MKTREAFRYTGRVLLIAGLTLAWGCIEMEPSPPVAGTDEFSCNRRALVIGIDGASSWLVRSMREEGLLPNLESIANQGSWGVARPSGEILSPRIWTTVATGKLPEKHGIVNWVRQDEDKTLHLFSSRDRTSHALWNILTDAGCSVAAVNWLMTHPPEKINGVIVSDHAAEGVMLDKVAVAQGFVVRYPDRKGSVRMDDLEVSFTNPAVWEDRLVGLREAEPLTGIANPFENEQLWGKGLMAEFFQKIYRNDEFAAAAALQIEAEFRPDLMLVYLPGIDKISHFLWDSVEPLESIPEELRRSDFERSVHGSGLRRYYRYVDALVGRLLEGRGADDLVIVLSDHGFELNLSGDRQGGIHESPKARDGVLYIRGRGVPRGRSNLVLRMSEIAPTLLAWMGMPPARDMDGRPGAFMEIEVLPPVDTYDLTPIEFVGKRSHEVESRMIDDLKTLGYVK